ncbi:MAG: tetratricopeptide repeat protein [Myxococcales bacterium]|nr:tetratricopeptide repeat protein [Myxococcales bacterium]
MTALGLAGLAAAYDLIDTLALGGGGIHVVATDAPAELRALLEATFTPDHPAPRAPGPIEPIFANVERDYIRAPVPPPYPERRRLFLDAVDPFDPADTPAVRALNTDRERLLRADRVAVVLVTGKDPDGADEALLRLSRRVPDFWTVRTHVHDVTTPRGPDADRRLRDRLIDRLAPLCRDRADAAIRLARRDLRADWIAHRLWRDGPGQQRWLEAVAAAPDPLARFHDSLVRRPDGLLGADPLDGLHVRGADDPPTVGSRRADAPPVSAPADRRAPRRPRTIRRRPRPGRRPLADIADIADDRAPAPRSPPPPRPPHRPDRWPVPRYPVAPLDPPHQLLTDAAAAELDARGRALVYQLPEDPDPRPLDAALLTAALLRADHYRAVIHLDARAGLAAAITAALTAAGDPAPPTDLVPALRRLAGALADAPALLVITGLTALDLGFIRALLPASPLLATLIDHPRHTFAVAASAPLPPLADWTRDQLDRWPDGATTVPPLHRTTAALELRRALATAHNLILLTAADTRLPPAALTPCTPPAPRVATFTLDPDDAPRSNASTPAATSAPTRSHRPRPPHRRRPRLAPAPARPRPPPHPLARRRRGQPRRPTHRRPRRPQPPPRPPGPRPPPRAHPRSRPAPLAAGCPRRRRRPRPSSPRSPTPRSPAPPSSPKSSPATRSTAAAPATPTCSPRSPRPPPPASASPRRRRRRPRPRPPAPLLTCAARRALVEPLTVDPPRWRLAPSIRAALRAARPEAAARARLDRWLLDRVADEPAATRGARFAAVEAEQPALLEWLADEDTDPVAAVIAGAFGYALACGPLPAWIAAARRALTRDPDAPTRAALHFRLGHLHQQAGDPAAALAAAAAMTAAAAEAGDDRDAALAAGLRADVHAAQGALDEALRIRREEQLPVYERLGDVRAQAVTMGKVADILQARGELDEALRIRRARSCRSDAPRRRAVAGGDDGQGRRHPRGAGASSTRRCGSGARRRCRSSSASATCGRRR